MILYILKSSIILGVLLAVYHVFFEKEKMHSFNRFYLLSGLALAFITPMITVGYIDPIVTTGSIIVTAPIVIQEVQSDLLYEAEQGMDWLTLMISIYSYICIIMLIRFIYNVSNLLIKVKRNTVVNKDGQTIVLLNGETLPHTFLHYVFVNKKDFESDQIESEIFIHEFTHANQYHSFDIILIELIQILYWFNPLIHFYKKAIQLNHEFLADKAVVDTSNRVPAYQEILIQKATQNSQINMASNFNFSVTKKRLLMMTKPISIKRNILYSLMIIPLSILLVSCFGDYENRRLTADSYINRFGDKISVDFQGMDQAQLLQVQNELIGEGIALTYDKIEYNSNDIMRMMDFTVDFGDGNSREFKMTTCNEDYYEINTPYGFWMNRSTGEQGTGFIQLEYNIKKASLYQKMTDQKDKGATYFIEGNQVTYDKAVAWLEKTDLWQSEYRPRDSKTSSGRFSLGSSINRSLNPFAKRIYFQDIPQEDLIQNQFDALLNDRTYSSGITNPQKEEIYSIYSKMSNHQKGLQQFMVDKVKGFAQTIPTESIFENWKDESTYGVWIDGNKIKNQDLNNYSNSDFSYFTQSKLTRNATDYGKYTYHVSAMTHKAFEKHNNEFAGEILIHQKSNGS